MSIGKPPPGQPIMPPPIGPFQPIRWPGLLGSGPDSIVILRDSAAIVWRNPYVSLEKPAAGPGPGSLRPAKHPVPLALAQGDEALPTATLPAESATPSEPTLAPSAEPTPAPEEEPTPVPEEPSATDSGNTPPRMLLPPPPSPSFGPKVSAAPTAALPATPAPEGLPDTEEEAEAYLAGLDDETAALVEPLMLQGASRASSGSSIDDAEASRFGSSYRIRVRWENLNSISSRTPASWCSDSYVAFQVPGIARESSPIFYFTKSILTSSEDSMFTLGEFTLPYTYRDAEAIFPTYLGVSSDVSLF